MTKRAKVFDIGFVVPPVDEAAVAARRAEHLGALEFILDDLRQNGIHGLKSFSQLVAPPYPKAAPFAEALPILLPHVATPRLDVTRLAVATAFCVPESHRFWNELVTACRNESDDQVKFTLAHALVAASAHRPLDDLIALALDRTLGSSRSAFLRPLSRVRDPRGLQTLSLLDGDPELANEMEEVKKLLARRKKK